MGLFKHSPGMTQEAFGQEFDLLRFFLPALISLENGQVQLHKKKYEGPFRLSPGNVGKLTGREVSS